MTAVAFERFNLAQLRYCSQSAHSYTFSVLQILFWMYLSLSVLLMVGYGYVAARASIGPRKGRARLIATLVFTSCFIVLPLLWAVYESQLPVFNFDGIITSVRMINTNPKYYSALLTIATTNGGEIEVHVSQMSDGWRVSQRLNVRYYGDTGELIRATLLSPEGAKQGTVSSTDGFVRFSSVALGLVSTWLAWKRYRQDPEGAVDRPPRSSELSDAVDRESMLHLSSRPDEKKH